MANLLEGLDTEGLSYAQSQCLIEILTDLQVAIELEQMSLDELKPVAERLLSTVLKHAGPSKAQPKWGLIECEGGCGQQVQVRPGTVGPVWCLACYNAQLGGTEAEDPVRY